MVATVSKSKQKLTDRVSFILDVLRPPYHKDPIEIHYTTPFQLVVGTILSAQCTDVRVNAVTANFFDRFKTAADFLKLSPEQLEEMIHSTGFFRNKAKSILGAARLIHDQYQGEVPNSLQALIRIPGFGRKTANVVQQALYHQNEGVVVDTHVLRLSRRLGLSKHTSPILVERDLMAITSQKNWHEISHFLILHGRRVCPARLPRCEICQLQTACPSARTIEKRTMKST